jgi:hypothetical protein
MAAPGIQRLGWPGQPGAGDLQQVVPYARIKIPDTLRADRKHNTHSSYVPV